jgi:DNA/RNA-binding domain of Phe-tRNA-synthetase-like protein
MLIESVEIAPEFHGAARLGLLQIERLQILESPEELKEMLQTLAGGLARQYKDHPLGEIPTIKKIRGIFHKAGLDPTRYRPSSESLLRRAVKGKGLYFINSAVDLINYFSLKTLWPMGLYDVSRVKGPVTWRAGCARECYEGIGRDVLSLACFPLLVDQEGPFGSPVSDSMRTRVTLESDSILWITFAPPETTIPLHDFAETMLRFCGGEVKVSVQL